MKATSLEKTSGHDGKLPGALPAGYTTLLADLKARVRAAQLRAVVSVNRELILFYWDIGRIIVVPLHDNLGEDDRDNPGEAIRGDRDKPGTG